MSPPDSWEFDGRAAEEGGHPRADVRVGAELALDVAKEVHRCGNECHPQTTAAGAAEAVDSVVATDEPCMLPPMGMLLDIPSSDPASLP